MNSSSAVEPQRVDLTSEEEEKDEKSVEEPPQKKRKATAAAWSCPVCFDSLSDEGVVPCVIKSCTRAAHMVCLDCVKNLRRRECPVCRTAFGALVPCPVTDLVAPHDQEAQKALHEYLVKHNLDAGNAKDSTKMDLARKKVAQVTQELEQKKIQIRAHEQNLKEKRIEYIVDRVHKFLASSKCSSDKSCLAWTLQNNKPHSWDTFAWKPRERRKKRIKRINALYASLQPHLDEIYKDTGFVVVLKKYTDGEVLGTGKQIRLWRISLKLPENFHQ